MNGTQFLQALLDARKLNPNAMAHKAGKPALQSTVVRFLAGKHSRPTTMQPIADFFGVDVGGFYDPDKAIMEAKRVGIIADVKATDVQMLAPTPSPGSPAIHIPLLANAASMGAGNDMQHDDVMVGSIALSPEWVSKRIRPAGALRFIHAYGDSMSPTFEDGDVVLVDTGRTTPSGADGVYVLATSKRVFIKRVTERTEGGFDVTSDNPAVKTVGSLNGSQQIDVLGRVVWCWNGKKL